MENFEHSDVLKIDEKLTQFLRIKHQYARKSVLCVVDVTEQTHQQGRVENMKDFMVFITFTSNFDTF